MNKSAYIFYSKNIRFLWYLINKSKKSIISHSDREGLHDFRVGFRRLKTLINIIASKEQRKPIYAKRKNILSPTNIRDVDVWLEFIENLPQDIKQQSYWNSYEMILSSRRQKGFENLRSYLQSQDYIKNMQSLRNMLIDLYFSLDKTFIKKRIKRIRKQFFSNMNTLLTAENITSEQLHSFRINTKSIRYTLEFIQRAFLLPLKDKISILKQLQQYLGHIHDLDMILLNIKETFDIMPYKDIEKMLTYLYEERNNILLQFMHYLYSIRGVKFKYNLD